MYLLHRRCTERNAAWLVMLAEQGGLCHLFAPANVRKRIAAVPSWEPGQCWLLQCRNDGEKRVVHTAECLAPAPYLRTKLALFSLFYVQELTRWFAGGQTYDGLLFAVYQSLMERFHREEDLCFLLRHYEAQLLGLAGYGLDFLYDGVGNPIDADLLYVYVPYNGFRIRTELIKPLEKWNLIAGEQLQSLNKEPPCSKELLHYLKALLRFCFSTYIGPLPDQTRRMWAT